MRDVVLYRNLRAGRRDPEVLVALEALAELPEYERLGFVTELNELLSDPDPAWRRAAIRALSRYMDGELAQEAVTAALDDPDESVRLEAVRANTWHIGRFVRALLHRRPDVRRAATLEVHARDFDEVRTVAFALRADPKVRDVVATGMPAPSLHFLHQFVCEGWLPREEARRLVRPYLRHGPHASYAPRLSTPNAFWRWVFDVFEGAPERARWRMLKSFLRATHGTPRDSAETLRDEYRRQSDPLLVRALGTLDARVFDDPSVPLDHRCRALREVDLGRAPLPEDASERDRLGRSLLRSELVRRRGGLPAGGLDLTAVLSVVGLCSSPGRALRGAVRADEVEEAVVADPLAAARVVAADRVSITGINDEMDAYVLLAASTSQPLFDAVVSPWSTFLTSHAQMEHVLSLARTTPLGRRSAKRLAERLVAHAHLVYEPLLCSALASSTPSTLDRLVVGELGRRFGPRILAVLNARLDGASLATRLADVGTFPFGLLRELAFRWRDHEQAERRAFATPRLPRPQGPVADGVTVLSSEEIESIVTAPRLAEALSSLKGPVAGLTSTLALRPAEPCVLACASLLVCGDPLRDVLTQLARFEGACVHDFEERVVRELSRFIGCSTLPLLGHVALAEHEVHAVAAFEAVAATPAALVKSLRRFRSARSKLARRMLWSAVAKVLASWSEREPERIAPYATDAFFELLFQAIGTVGPAAAQAFIACDDAGVARSRHVARLVSYGESCEHDDTRRILVDWIAARIAKPTDRPLTPRVHPPANPPAGVRARRARGIEPGDDVGFLTRVASSQLPPATAALHRLVELRPKPEDLDPWARFHVGMATLDDEAVVAALLAPPCFDEGMVMRDEAVLSAMVTQLEASEGRPLEVLLTSDDVEALLGRLGARRFVLELATSPHEPIYRRVVDLCSAPEKHGLSEADARDALREFLEAGHGGPLARVDAACALDRLGDDMGLPVRIRSALLGSVSAPVGAVLDAALASGDDIYEWSAAELALPQDVDGTFAARLLRARGPGVRAMASAKLVGAQHVSRDAKVRALAMAFAWGRRKARELTGADAPIHLTTGRELAFIDLERPTIHVSGWPILEGAPGGRSIVEGLILHELGHQLYHSDDTSRALWSRSREERLQQLFNLVLDEHLERRLRARDQGDGDRLKRVAAYAFHHMGRSFGDIGALLAAVGPRAVPALIGRLRPSVCGGFLVKSGELLRAVIDAGGSFARFVRALRMGQRADDDGPVVREALSLFDRDFRNLETEALYELTQRLAELFGDEVALLDAIGSPDEVGIMGREPFRPVSDDEVQREVARILTAPARKSTTRPSRSVNLGSDERFDPIDRVVRLSPNRDRRQDVAREIAAPARRLRAELEALGLTRISVGAKLAGTRVDRSRLPGLVVRGDPRVLRAHTVVPRADLFLGVAVDCSLSMTGERIELARRFAVMLAESARGLRGIDLRLFGFTDSQLFDAGDAERCAAERLAATDAGNNDAAALAHLAQLARFSPRRAKLLVMISDGLPTACSVTALRALVRRLTREGMACAQIAVQPIEERCFEHYVEVRDLETHQAVRRFAAVIARLVRQTIGTT